MCHPGSAGYPCPARGPIGSWLLWPNPAVTVLLLLLLLLLLSLFTQPPREGRPRSFAHTTRPPPPLSHGGPPRCCGGGSAVRACALPAVIEAPPGHDARFAHCPPLELEAAPPAVLTPATPRPPFPIGTPPGPSLIRPPLGPFPGAGPENGGGGPRLNGAGGRGALRPPRCARGLSLRDVRDPIRQFLPQHKIQRRSAVPPVRQDRPSRPAVQV